MQREPANAVKRVLLVNSNEGSNAALITASLLGWFAVVCRTVYAQDASESLPPSRLDFFQDGYSFGRFVSAVSLPRIR